MTSLFTRLLGKFLEELVGVFVSLFQKWLDFSPQAKVSQVAVATIVYFLYSVLQDPNGAINSFIILIIDHVIDIFPSTPEEYTIGFLLTNFAEEVPYIGWGVVYEIFEGMAGMFALWSVIKVWKLLPFT